MVLHGEGPGARLLAGLGRHRVHPLDPELEAAAVEVPAGGAQAVAVAHDRLGGGEGGLGLGGVSGGLPGSSHTGCTSTARTHNSAFSGFGRGWEGGEW